MLPSVIATLLLSACLAAEPATTAAAEPPSTAAPATSPQPDGLAAALARADAAWKERDAPGALGELQAALDEAARLAPGDYGLLWRQARLTTWQAEDPGIKDEQKSKLGKRAWDLAEQATRVDPEGVEGWFYAAAGMGNYALGIGIFSALSQGIEGKFKERLSRAERISPRFLDGGIQVAWGRFWFKLPWPKHDAGKCRTALKAALAQDPEGVRARVYLGDLEADEGHKDQARAAWEAALAVHPEASDGPEGRRWQAVAKASLERLGRR
jgi:tetratricopeptide (TPR) repeat protein